MGALKSKRCTRGHLLRGRNLYYRKDGTRECRACSLRRNHQWQKAKRSKRKKV